MRNRVEFANGLRGIAALCVVVSHYLGVYWFNREAVADLIKAPVLSAELVPTPTYLEPLQIHPLFNWGAFGVALFFWLAALSSRTRWSSARASPLPLPVSFG